MLWLALALSANALDVEPARARAVEVVALKSGTTLQLDAAQYPGRMTVITPVGEARVLALECGLDDAAHWRSWGGFFTRVAAEDLPATYITTDGGCSAKASYGDTDKTQNVVTLSIEAPLEEGALVVATTLSRREAEDLANRLVSLSKEAVPAPEPEPEPAPAVCDALNVELVTALYAIKGWRRDDDPGWQADVDAMTAVVEAGTWLPSQVISKAASDRKLRPGALGDLLSDN